MHVTKRSGRKSPKLFIVVIAKEGFGVEKDHQRHLRSSLSIFIFCRDNLFIYCLHN